MHSGRGPSTDPNVLALATEGCNAKYPTEDDWPGSEHPWCTLRDCIQPIKEEGMKAAIFSRGR